MRAWFCACFRMGTVTKRSFAGLFDAPCFQQAASCSTGFLSIYSNTSSFVYIPRYTYNIIYICSLLEYLKPIATFQTYIPITYTIPYLYLYLYLYPYRPRIPIPVPYLSTSTDTFVPIPIYKYLGYTYTYTYSYLYQT